MPSVIAPGASANSQATRAAASADTSFAVRAVTVAIAARPARFARIRAGSRWFPNTAKVAGTSGKKPCSVEGGPPG
jgi:hypothetical protein